MLTRSLTATVLAALLVATSITCDLFNPHATTRFDTRGSALDVFARNDTLLVAAGDSGLLAFDISKPKAPRELWRIVVTSYCRCVTAENGVAYIGTNAGVVAYGLAHGTRAQFPCGGTSQVVTGLAVDSTRLYAAASDGVTVFSLAAPDSAKFVPLAGDSLALDTLQLGKHNRAEGVIMSPGGYCIISQGDSGVVVYHSPTPDSVELNGGGGGASQPTYATAATDGVRQVYIYEADSSTVVISNLDERGGASFGSEMDFAKFTGFTRRICIGGNGYVYTASGDAGVYIIRE